MSQETNKIIFKSSLWIKIVFLPILFVSITPLEIRAYLNGEDLMDTVNIMLILFFLILTICLYHESHIEISLHPEFIIYKKGVFPRRIILKEDISSIFKKSINRKAGPVIVLKIKRKEEIRISPNLFAKDPYETLRKYRSNLDF